jgi:hypothetical protein
MHASNLFIHSTVIIHLPYLPLHPKVEYCPSITISVLYGIVSCFSLIRQLSSVLVGGCDLPDTARSNQVIAGE